jgi:uncharacterized protein YkwD
MKSIALCTMLIALVGTAAFGQAALSSVEQDLVNRVNQERARARLAGLRVNARLMQAAREHSANMARQRKGSHVLDGKGPGERLRDVGYRARMWAENIAWGARTPQQVMSLWMNSPPHRSNILHRGVDEIGVGVAYARDGTPYWTQVFGRR